LWRKSDVLQLGVDTPLILERVPSELAHAVALLSQPQTRASLTHSLPDLDAVWIDWLLAQLTRANLVATDRTATARDVCVVGSGKLATALVDALGEAGYSPVRRLASSTESWLYPGRASHWADDKNPWGELTIVATHTAEPDRTLTDELSRAGQAHMIVRLADDKAVVGPMVEPGLTPCVRCADMMRGSFDSAWPQLLAQLCRVNPDPPADLRSWAVATAVLQVRARFDGVAAPDALGRVLQIDAADHVLTTMDLRPHPDCGCMGAW